MKSNWRKSCGGPWCFGPALVLAAVTVSLTPAQQPARDVSKEAARLSRDWVRDGVIYQIYERDFSPEGTFNGVTAQLDRLKDLGVTILWLMPAHPIGREKKKGSIGSPYAVRDYYAINSDYGTRDDLKRVISQPHRLGQCLDEASRLVQARRQRQDHLSVRLVRHRRAQLHER